MPTPLLAELLRNGAKLRPLCPPGEEPEPGYRPSAKMTRYVRARDLTCRFPGCTMPAEFCDIDHVIPYPLGATHPSNLACLCRKHHHLKTFWTGDWELQTADPMVRRCGRRRPGAPTPLIRGVEVTSPTGTPTPVTFHPHPAGDVQHRPGFDDAPAQTHPRRRPSRPHQSRTRTNNGPTATRSATVLDEPGADAAHRLLDITRRSREGQSHE